MKEHTWDVLGDVLVICSVQTVWQNWALRFFVVLSANLKEKKKKWRWDTGSVNNCKAKREEHNESEKQSAHQTWVSQMSVWVIYWQQGAWFYLCVRIFYEEATRLNLSAWTRIWSFLLTLWGLGVQPLQCQKINRNLWKNVKKKKKEVEIERNKYKKVNKNVTTYCFCS